MLGLTPLQSDAACGAIALTDCSHVEKLQTRGFVLHQEAVRDPSGAQVSEGSDYVFTAETPSERDDWVDIIDSFLHLLDRKTLVESITLNSQAQKQEHSQKLRHCRYLEVKLLQAKDLPAMDISGTSDTYWMLKCQDTVHRSETVWKNNKDPRWDETFNLYAHTSGPSLTRFLSLSHTHSLSVLCVCDGVCVCARACVCVRVYVRMCACMRKSERERTLCDWRKQRKELRTVARETRPV